MFLIMGKMKQILIRARVTDKGGKGKQKLKKESKGKGTTKSKVDPHITHSEEHSAENKIN